MASINGVAIKNLKEFKDHEGMPCYKGNVYIENKKIGFWSQDPWGAICDDFHFNEPYSEELLKKKINELNQDKVISGTALNGEKYTIDYDLERLFTDILTLIDDEKLFKKAQKAGYEGIVVLSNSFHVVCLNLNKKYMSLTDENLLNVLSKEIEDTKNNVFFKEDDFKKHTIKIYRNLTDFNIGTPITLKDISRELSIDEKIKNLKKQSTGSKVIDNNTLER